MQNRFIKNIIFLLFLNLLVKPFWILGIDREVQNLLGDASYGTYQALFNFSYLFYILLDLGITNFNSRAVAQDPKNLSKHFGGLTEIKLLLGLLYACVIFVVGYFCGYNEGLKLKLLFWCGLNQILLSFILFLRSNIQGLLLFKQDSILSVFDRVLAIVIMCLVLWSGWFPRERFNAIWYLQAQTLAYICTLLFALTVVLRHAENISFKINIQFFKEILKQSLPFALLVLLMSVYSRIEPVLLERLLDDKGIQAGIYSRAYRLFDAGNNISNLFAIMLLPMFTATIKNKPELNNLIKTSFNVIVAMAGIVLVLCVFFNHEIMQMMYNPEEAETHAAYYLRINQYAKVFPLLMGSFFCLSTTYVFGTLLTANGSLKQLNIVAAAGVVINILLNLIIIPRFQAFGAACTSLFVQTFTALLQYLLAKRILHFNMGRRYWFHIFLFAGTIILVTFLIKQLNINWIIGFCLAFAINCGAIFFTRLLRFQEIASLVLPKEKKA
ncbi:MAG: oligosaccharide flippase family protein [Bacteroidales bacterium]|nr:oligosaccharide flippase family protein [Bacteroidales bacterium]